MATASNEAIAAPRGVGRGFRVGWGLGTLAAVAVATVAVVAVASLTHTDRVATIDEPTQGTSSLYSPDELTVMRLVAKGYIHAETLNSEPFISKGLINQGLVPRESLRPGMVSVPSLYSAQEQAVMAAVARGAVPSEALETKTYLIKRLINQGLISRQAADTQAPGAGR